MAVPHTHIHINEGMKWKLHYPMRGYDLNIQLGGGFYHVWLSISYYYSFL